jgi:putative heme-binding domain-containing protein
VRARNVSLGLILAVGLLASGAPPIAQMHAGQYEQADIDYGAQIFAGRCVACHGEQGDLVPTANLRRGQFRNASSDRELGNVIRNGIPGTAMVATGYSDSEITALVAYLRNITVVDVRGILQGDVARGRGLFFGEGDCDSCHRVAGVGPRSAPDLTAIGAARSAAVLQRTLVDPNAAMLPINRPVRLVTRDGAIVEGRRLNEDTFTVQVIDKDERLLSFEKADLREYSVSKEARMPSYQAVFDEQERADLVAYMLSLKGIN